MARNPRRANREWETPKEGFQWEHVQVELLMDIRAELQRLNALLHCHNFTGIPTTLRSIRRAVAKPRPKKAKA